MGNPLQGISSVPTFITKFRRCEKVSLFSAVKRRRHPPKDSCWRHHRSGWKMACSQDCNDNQNLQWLLSLNSYEEAMLLRKELMLHIQGNLYKFCSWETVEDPSQKGLLNPHWAFELGKDELPFSMVLALWHQFTHPTRNIHVIAESFKQRQMTSVNKSLVGS